MNDETVSDFALWVKENPPPDLQDLVRRHGNYYSIPPAAWAQFDQDMQRWNDQRRSRLSR
jgi:hypothetical protein